MFVIGVAGQAQNGKDTLADYLKDALNKDGGMAWTRAAFAANVKKVFMDTFGVDMAFIEKWKVIAENPPGFDMPIRQGLQFIGDGFRKIKSTIWLDLAFRDKTPKIISDVRYVNEFKRVKREGGLNILIGRPDKLNDDPNGSEAQIKPYVEWCLKHYDQVAPRFNIIDKPWLWSKISASAWPDSLDAFDVFIRNDGTKEDLFKLIDESLVPFVKNFVFEFPAEPQEEEEKCLISN